MKLPKKIFECIASNFIYYFSEEGDARNQAIKILKIYDIKVNRDCLEHKEFTYEGPVKKPLFSMPYSNINRLDIESFEAILNNDLQTACLMSPLFDCIGWVISNSSGAWRVLFVGSATYDLWKQVYFNSEESMSWKEGLDELDYNWKKGKGWVDGVDMEQPRTQPVWKSIED